MPERAPTPKRYRPPSGSLSLIYIVAAVTASLASVAVVVAVVAIVRVHDTVDRNEAAITATYASRRSGAEEACQQREALKADLRRVLRRFGVSRDELPPSAAGDGSRALDPYPGGCTTYVNVVVPRSTKP